MARCLLALGANLGNRENALQEALRKLTKLPFTCVLKRSRWHENPAVGGPAGQPPFLNAAVLLETALRVEDLVGQLQAIEHQVGRERKVRWAARTLDIDVLLYDDAMIETPQLSIPHPRMTFRRFVLTPAAEIAGHLVVPPARGTIASLLRHLDDAPRYVAIAARDSAVADWLASELCKRLNFPCLKDFLPKIYDSQDPCLLAAREWQHQETLRERLNPRNQRMKSSLAPVIGSSWKPAANVPDSIGVVRPALVIAVVPPPGKSLDLSSVARQESEHSCCQRQEFEQVLEHGSSGPFARIAAAQPEEIVDEALAAILAAWPEHVP